MVVAAKNFRRRIERKLRLTFAHELFATRHIARRHSRDDVVAGMKERLPVFARDVRRAEDSPTEFSHIFICVADDVSRRTMKKNGADLRPRLRKKCCRLAHAFQNYLNHHRLAADGLRIPSELAVFLAWITPSRLPCCQTFFHDALWFTE